VSTPTPASTPSTVAALRKAALGSPAPEPVQSSTRAVSNNSNNAPAASSGGYGCAAALAYLSSHAAPGFSFSCPGYAYGNQAMTCVNHAPQCPNAKIIAIAVPCAAAYMNEASNSWVLTGARSGAIDPYGHC
jgi:hypothetical protein